MKLFGYTLHQITAGIGTHRIRNITFTMVVENRGKNYTGNTIYFTQSNV